MAEIQGSGEFTANWAHYLDEGISLPISLAVSSHRDIN
jgi:hypothetical protein